MLFAVFLLLFGFRACWFVRLTFGWGDESGLLNKVMHPRVCYGKGLTAWPCIEGEKDVSLQLLLRKFHSDHSVFLFMLPACPALTLSRPCCLAWKVGSSSSAMFLICWVCLWISICESEYHESEYHENIRISWISWDTRFHFCSGWDIYCMVEVGLGSWFSGEQSSVGEGRPSESSLSRWTWGRRRWSFSITTYYTTQAHKELEPIIAILGRTQCYTVLTTAPLHHWTTLLYISAELITWAKCGYVELKSKRKTHTSVSTFFANFVLLMLSLNCFIRILSEEEQETNYCYSQHRDCRYDTRWPAPPIFSKVNTGGAGEKVNRALKKFNCSRVGKGTTDLKNLLYLLLYFFLFF